MVGMATMGSARFQSRAADSVTKRISDYDCTPIDKTARRLPDITTLADLEQEYNQDKPGKLDDPIFLAKVEHAAKLEKPDHPHGQGGYNNHRCRCLCCRIANTLGMRGRRRPKLTVVKEDPEPLTVQEKRDRELRSPFSGYTKSLDGMTVTFVHEDGRLWSEWFPGFGTQGKKNEAPTIHPENSMSGIATYMVEWMERRLGEGWKIRCISSPDTIWRDLQGVRSISHRPEYAILARIGRMDVLEKQPVMAKTRSRAKEEVRRRRSLVDDARGGEAVA